MPRREIEQPNDYVLARGNWPDGPFRQNTPRSVLKEALLVRTLIARMAETGTSQSALADKTDIGRSAVNRLLTGVTFPDLHSVARLENHFNTDLWPTNEALEQMISDELKSS